MPPIPQVPTLPPEPTNRFYWAKFFASRLVATSMPARLMFRIQRHLLFLQASYCLTVARRWLSTNWLSHPRLSTSNVPFDWLIDWLRSYSFIQLTPTHPTICRWHTLLFTVNTPVNLSPSHCMIHRHLRCRGWGLDQAAQDWKLAADEVGSYVPNPVTTTRPPPPTSLSPNLTDPN